LVPKEGVWTVRGGKLVSRKQQGGGRHRQTRQPGKFWVKRSAGIGRILWCLASDLGRKKRGEKKKERRNTTTPKRKTELWKGTWGRLK